MSAMDTDYAEEEVVENPTLKAAYNLAPLHHNQPLIWNYEVDLIGEKIYDKVIHLCEICELPILVYGRMLPCKHIFCFDCARKCEKTCKRCSVRVQKVEKSALGTVYVCTHGAPKHSTKGCRRTYLSQRDLQSHIAHRHMPKPVSDTKTQSAVTAPQPAGPQLPLTQQQAAMQQATQLASQPTSVSVPPLSVQPPIPSGLVPSLTDLTTPQPAQSHPGVMNLSVLPGLGDLQTGSSTSPLIGQSSPALPPDLNPNPKGVRMNFNLPSQIGSDQGMYRDIDRSLVPMSQQQQQHRMGMGGGHFTGVPKPKPMPRFGEPSQLPVSAAMMQSMNSQQMNAMGQRSPSMHMTAQMHQHRQQQLLQEQQHQLLQEQQQHHLLREQHLLQEHQQQRLNLHHHDSVSKMPGSMLSSTHPHPQVQTNMDSFASSPGSYDKLQAGQSRTNVNLITVPIQDESHYQPMPMVGQSQGNNLSFPPPRPGMSQNFSQAEMNSPNFAHVGGKQTNSPNLGGGMSSNQSVPFSQPSGNMRMNNPMRMNPANALVDIIQAFANPPGRSQGGLMPIPNTSSPGFLNSRFKQTNWTPNSPRPPPRMPQNQPRPRW